MLSPSNQPARIDTSTETNKLLSVDSMNKFRPIIDQTGTIPYNAAKIISDYLSPLCKNKYTINDTLSLADMI